MSIIELHELLVRFASPYGVTVDKAFVDGYFPHVETYRSEQVRKALIQLTGEADRKKFPLPGELKSKIATAPRDYESGDQRERLISINERIDRAAGSGLAILITRRADGRSGWTLGHVMAHFSESRERFFGRLRTVYYTN